MTEASLINFIYKTKSEIRPWGHEVLCFIRIIDIEEFFGLFDNGMLKIYPSSKSHIVIDLEPLCEYSGISLEIIKEIKV